MYSFSQAIFLAFVHMKQFSNDSVRCTQTLFTSQEIMISGTSMILLGDYSKGQSILVRYYLILRISIRLLQTSHFYRLVRLFLSKDIDFLEIQCGFQRTRLLKIISMVGPILFSLKMEKNGCINGMIYSESLLKLN